MSFVRVVVPYALAFYFIFKALKDPIFILGIPFLMTVRESIFFERATLFYKPGSWGPNLNMLTWLIVSWIYIRFVAKPRIVASASQDTGKKNFVTLMDFVVCLLLVLSVMNLISNLAEYGDTPGMIAEAADYVSLLIGYFFLKSIFIHSHEESLIRFLDAIVFIITISSLFFILHQGLGFTIYQGGEYLVTTFAGGTISRTFWFMPIYMPFAFVYCLSKGRFTLVNITLMLVNAAGIFFSYTRSAVFGLVLVTSLYYVLVGIKQKRKLRAIWRYLILGSVVFIGMYLAESLVPAKYAYFSDRLEDLALNPQKNNFTYRLDQGELFLARLGSEQFIFGSGFLSQTDNPIVAFADLKTSDMVWVGVVFRWGVVGLSLFGLIFVISLVKTHKMFSDFYGPLSYLALLLFLLVLDQLAEGFASWTFLHPDRFPMGLWYFGLASALSIKGNEISRLSPGGAPR